MPGSQVGHVAIGYLWDEAVDTYCWSVLMEAAAAQSDQDSQTSEGYHYRMIEVEISRDYAERFFSSGLPLYRLCAEDVSEIRTQLTPQIGDALSGWKIR